MKLFNKTKETYTCLPFKNSPSIIFVLVLVSYFMVAVTACSETNSATFSHQDIQKTDFIKIPNNQGTQDKQDNESYLTDISQQQQKIAANLHNPVVAVIDDKGITLSELDTKIQFGLFDLEWQKYRLRKQAMRALIDETSVSSNNSADKEGKHAEILLAPPEPPRINLPSDGRMIKGDKNASIVLDIFCSYQSSHCARLQPVLNELLQIYKHHVAFRFYDFPQRYHRYGQSAANAFHCVSDASHSDAKSWEFQESLFADISQLNQQRFLLIADQLGLNKTTFKRCLSNRTYQNKIDSDLRLVKQLGITNVPVTFINGLYVKADNQTEIFKFYIDKELQSRGIKLSSEIAVESQLALTLVATSVSNQANLSSAIISNDAIGKVSSFKIGEQLLTDVNLVEIKKDHILINNKGVTESIKIQNSQGYQKADLSEYVSTPYNTNQLFNDTEQFDKSDDKDYEAQPRSLPVTGTLTLNKEWVDNQLLNQTELEKYFYQAEHMVEGVHLIKLKNIDQQRFYTTLGLKTGDVIMRINEQWVHESQNPLWTSLSEGEKISMIVMRKGLPYRYDYLIE